MRRGRNPRTGDSAAAAAVPVVPAAAARRLLLGAQGLLDDPASFGRATPRRLASLISRMGFVQVDTINTVGRAHHLILAARIDGYQPELLARAIERHRFLFEHWTHDASIIPVAWYAHWHHRFERYRASRWHLRQMGAEADRVLAAVLDRITSEGPLSSSDFEHEGGNGKTSWWGWKPHKVALDYLWRTGALHVAARRNFEKVYDLTERVLPPAHAKLPVPEESEHVAWACRTALERLGTATAREVSQFWHAVPVTSAAAWLSAAAEAGEVMRVLIESADGSPPRPGYALPGLSRRIAGLPDAPGGVRILAPFDPVVRDRARAKRLFGFDFRFEGFVPAAKRVHGYYVMPVLEGDRFVARADPKFDRPSGTLKIRRLTWEPGVRVTRKRLAAFEEGAWKLAGWVGATRVELPR